MKQMVCLIVLAVMFAVNVSAKMKKEVIIFSQPCRFCDLLKKDLNENLISEYPNIQFTVLDIREYILSFEQEQISRLPSSNL